MVPHSNLRSPLVVDVNWNVGFTCSATCRSIFTRKGRSINIVTVSVHTWHPAKLLGTYRYAVLNYIALCIWQVALPQKLNGDLFAPTLIGAFRWAVISIAAASR